MDEWSVSGIEKLFERRLKITVNGYVYSIACCACRIKITAADLINFN
jgi:hypothetical protein